MDNRYYRFSNTPTHRIRAQEKKLRKKVLITLISGISLILFAFFIGLPLFVQLLAGMGDLKKPPDEQKNETIILMPPVWDYLPEATNTAKIKLTGSGEKDTKIQLILNGKKKGTTETDDEGKFTFPNIPLSDGENIFTVFSVKDDQESTTSSPLKITYRENAAEIEISSPSDGQTFYSENKEILLEGKTDPEGKLTVNGRFVILDSEGNFSHKVKLSDGDNAFKFELKDKAGNHAEKEISLKYIP